MSSDICSCGRDNVKVHCPSCGRFACYAKVSKAYVAQTSSGPVRIMSYHCRGCGIDFDDLDRARCEAPKRGLSIQAQRASDTITTSLEGLPTAERLAKLRELLGDKK